MYGGDCYVMLYTYLVAGKESYLIYFWQVSAPVPSVRPLRTGAAQPSTHLQVFSVDSAGKKKHLNYTWYTNMGVVYGS